VEQGKTDGGKCIWHYDRQMKNFPYTNRRKRRLVLSSNAAETLEWKPRDLALSSKCRTNDGIAKDAERSSAKSLSNLNARQLELDAYLAEADAWIARTQVSK
ncbi:unnamed protein product, partial [Allacma fusca]